MQAVQRGFQQVINIEYLAIFDANEMEGLFCGCAESADDSVWSRAILQAAIRPDHGYNSDSIQITWLIDMLLSFTQEEVLILIIQPSY
jgi:E3 ubiquitin-protein ligase TRIP12